MDIPKEITDILKGNSIEELAVNVLYKNWRGEDGVRKIIPLQIYFGSTEFHPINQWLIKVWDCEKNDYRTYAFKDNELPRGKPTRYHGDVINKTT